MPVNFLPSLRVGCHPARRSLRCASAVAVVAWLAFSSCALGATDYAANIAALIDPAKLATLGPRGANPRVQKAVYWLAEARKAGLDPSKVLDRSLALANYRRSRPVRLTKDALLRNLKIADKLGCLDAAGLNEMRRGNAPTITRGPNRGDELSVDHIVPRAVAPELDNVIANLELMPMRMNEEKNAKVGSRQLSHAKALYNAGLLGKPGLARVKAARL